MISSSSERQNLNTEIIADPEYVRVQRLLQLTRDRIDSVLRAENAVNEIVGIGV